ncbi:MAG: hypothetical protein V4568_14020 [Pseudomonadota bacterium]
MNLDSDLENAHQKIESVLTELEGIAASYTPIRELAATLSNLVNREETTPSLDAAKEKIQELLSQLEKPEKACAEKRKEADLVRESIEEEQRKTSYYLIEGRVNDLAERARRLDIDINDLIAKRREPVKNARKLLAEITDYFIDNEAISDQIKELSQELIYVAGTSTPDEELEPRERLKREIGQRLGIYSVNLQQIGAASENLEDLEFSRSINSSKRHIFLLEKTNELLEAGNVSDEIIEAIETLLQQTIFFQPTEILHSRQSIWDVDSSNPSATQLFCAMRFLELFENLNTLLINVPVEQGFIAGIRQKRALSEVAQKPVRLFHEITQSLARKGSQPISVEQQQQWIDTLEKFENQVASYLSGISAPTETAQDLHYVIPALKTAFIEVQLAIVEIYKNSFLLATSALSPYLEEQSRTIKVHNDFLNSRAIKGANVKIEFSSEDKIASQKHEETIEKLLKAVDRFTKWRSALNFVSQEGQGRPAEQISIHANLECLRKLTNHLKPKSVPDKEVDQAKKQIRKDLHSHHPMQLRAAITKQLQILDEIAQPAKPVKVSETEVRYHATNEETKYLRDILYLANLNIKEALHLETLIKQSKHRLAMPRSAAELDTMCADLRGQKFDAAPKASTSKTIQINPSPEAEALPESEEHVEPEAIKEGGIPKHILDQLPRRNNGSLNCGTCPPVGLRIVHSIDKPKIYGLSSDALYIKDPQAHKDRALKVPLSRLIDSGWNMDALRTALAEKTPYADDIASTREITARKIALADIPLHIVHQLPRDQSNNVSCLMAPSEEISFPVNRVLALDKTPGIGALYIMETKDLAGRIPLKRLMDNGYDPEVLEHYVANVNRRINVPGSISLSSEEALKNVPSSLIEQIKEKQGPFICDFVVSEKWHVDGRNILGIDTTPNTGALYVNDPDNARVRRIPLQRIEGSGHNIEDLARAVGERLERGTVPKSFSISSEADIRKLKPKAPGQSVLKGKSKDTGGSRR